MWLLTGHTAKAEYALRFFRNADKIASGGSHRNVLVWDFAAHGTALACSSDDKPSEKRQRVATASASKGRKSQADKQKLREEQLEVRYITIDSSVYQVVQIIDTECRPSHRDGSVYVDCSPNPF